MTPSTAAIVPAAGAATRFGGNKLTADIAGRPLLDLTLHSLLDAGVPTVILVAAATGAFPQVPAAADRRVQPAVNPEPARGMFSSIQCGLAQVPVDVSWIIVLPADMPFVQPATVSRLIDAAATGMGNSGAAYVPVFGGRRGHPIVLPAALGEPLLEQPASSNLKAALLSLRVPMRELPVDDPGVVRDVDVKADL